MMTSLAVWAIIVGYVTSEWGTTAMATYVPTYMSEVLKYDIKQVIDLFLNHLVLNMHQSIPHHMQSGNTICGATITKGHSLIAAEYTLHIIDLCRCS